MKGLIIQDFGKSNILSGDEIKEKLMRIYFECGVKLYPTIKTLEDFGYSLERKKEGERFLYHIKLK